jgi:hypothetical protein
LPAKGSTRFYVGNHQLNRLVSTKLVDVEFVSQFDPLDGRIRPDVAVDAKGNAVELDRTTLAPQYHFEVPFANHALLHQLKHPVKQRLRKVLSPRPGMAQCPGKLQVKLLDRQGAVRQQTPGAAPRPHSVHRGCESPAPNVPSP